MKHQLNSRSSSRLKLASLFLVFTLLIVFGFFKLLLWVAPWREFEIYCVTIFYALFSVSLFSIIKKKKCLAYIFYLNAFFASLGLVAGYYLLFTKHNELEYPSLDLAIETERLDFLEQTKLTYSNRMSLFHLIGHKDSADKVLENAQGFMLFKHKYYKYPVAQLPENYDWNEDPFNDPSWSFRLHNMGYVVSLSRAYEISRKNDYLARAEFLILDWINDNRLYLFEPPSEFSWNDHSTAFRLINWLYFYEVWKTSPIYSSEKAEILLRGMLGHATLLASADFYTKNHNHGIDQDRALLAFSLMHPNFAQSTQWRELAQNRMAEQFDFSVSDNGVHLEHSPEYHMYGLKQRFNTLLFLNDWGTESNFTKKIETSVRKMSRFVSNIIKPNGEIVQVGDSRKVHVSEYKGLLNKLEETPPLVQSLLTETEPKTENIPFTSNYKDEGYVSLRDFSDDRQRFKSSFYLFFTTAANEGKAHRQSDHLSFTLSNLENEIFIDPGYYSYKNDDGRKFVTSVFAHNSIAVNGLNYEGWNSTLEDVKSTANYTLITASHTNYANLQHRRGLLKFKEDIFVIDIVRDLSAAPGKANIHNFQQLFNISPNLKTKLIPSSKKDILIVSDLLGREIMSIEELNTNVTKRRIAEGELNPMIGWHTLEHGKLIESPTLVSQQQGNNALYVTHIKIPSKKNTNLDEDWTLKADLAIKNDTDFSLTINSTQQRLKLVGNVKLGTLSIKK
jgi:hypothetical protein